MNIGDAMVNQPLDLLKTWMSLRELSAEEIRKRCAISEQHIARDTTYIRLTGLTRFRNRDAHPGQFYFRNAQFIVFYVEDMSEELEQLTPQLLLDYFGEPEAVLRSRAGKDHNQYVYPKKGVAFSANNYKVSYLEIFHPTSLEMYKAQFYFEPSAFTK